MKITIKTSKLDLGLYDSPQEIHDKAEAVIPYVGEIKASGIDTFDVGILPGVADHLNAQLAKVSKNATSVEAGNAALEVALWVRDHIRFIADRHPNS